MVVSFQSIPISIIVFASLVTVVVAAIVLLWLYAPRPIGTSIFSIPGNDKVVALTIDDGPNPPYTEQLLEVLEEEGVRATFFVVGKYAEAYPDSVRRIIAAGHQVGNHLYDDKIPAFMSQKKVKEWLDLTESKLRELGARGPIRYRAPRLMVGLHTTRMMRARGEPHVAALVFGDDWMTQKPERITEVVLKHTKPGSIIVLHDGYDAKPNTYRGGSVEAARNVIRELKQRGYRFLTIEEVLDRVAAAQEQVPFWVQSN